MQEETQNKLKELQPAFADIEAQRKAMLAKANTKTIWIFIAMIATVFAIVSLGINLYWEGFHIFVFCFVVCLFGLSIIRSYRMPYHQRLTQAVGNMIMQLLQPDWGYKVNRHLSPNKFKGLGLVKRFDKAEGSHLTEGRHGETDFSYSFVNLKVHGQRKSKSVFNGLVLVADFHKNITGRTLIFPDIAQRELGSWLGKKVQEQGWRGLELVYLEDPIFEKAFAVYSHDQIEARYILSPSMMERLVDLNQKYENQISFAFSKNKVCVAIKNLTPPPIDLDIAISSDGTLHHFNKSIDAVKEIIDIMELNTRIWEKE